MTQIYTTSEAARICKVTPNTVGIWFDRGHLKGYRIPGSQSRRIPREGLIEFFNRHAFPLPDELKDKPVESPPAEPDDDRLPFHLLWEVDMKSPDDEPIATKNALLKVCELVHELETALSFVTDECRLTNPVEVSYTMRDGEGFLQVEPSPHHMLHRLWSLCVDTPGYDKEAWRNVEQQLHAVGSQSSGQTPATAAETWTAIQEPTGD